MVDFIYQYPNSIPKILCEDIIQLFEEEQDKYEGVVISGLNKNVKDTTDFVIPKRNDKWKKIEKFLYKELFNKIIRYKNNLQQNEYNNYNIKFLFLKGDLFAKDFLISKYRQNTGKYIYHNDFSYSEKSARVITFLWYLNDIEEGGETIFWDNYKIKPESGKLILFPATWTYPHTGKIPISSNKYIITGWLEHT